MTRRVVEKLCTKKVCVDFLAPKQRSKTLTHVGKWGAPPGTDAHADVWFNGDVRDE